MGFLCVWNVLYWLWYEYLFNIPLAMSFENYLIKKGYKRFVVENGKLYEPKNFYYSSLNHFIRCIFKKDINDKFGIVFGLNDYGMPPILIEPRPNIKDVIHKGYRFSFPYDDGVMSRILNDTDFDLIYESLLNRDVLIEVNWSDEEKDDLLNDLKKQ